MFGGNFAPAGWAFCDGQTLAISENDVLFQLIGTTYGGDGQETFNLPDLQGRASMHMGQGPGLSQNYTEGEAAGVEAVTVTAQQTPIHTHSFLASTNNSLNTSPTNNVMAAGITTKMFTEDVANQPLNNAAVTPQGGNQPHDNMQPYLCIAFIISLFGVFPSQT
jgi:microcystin-dependent protein